MTRLLVLGVVRTFQPVHGYDVRRELITWHAQEWANVAPGSIYNALKSLARDGLLEVAGTDQVGARPERTSYKLTSKGELELNELLRDTLWQVQPLVDPLIAALSLMHFIDRDELIKALDARAAMIEGASKHAQIVIEAIDDVETPAHVREMMRLIDARMTAELAWAKAFKARLRAGEYRTRGDAPFNPGVKGDAKSARRTPKKSAKSHAPAGKRKTRLRS
jgi:DNA-binding PadR family transcriptional regulator